MIDGISKHSELDNKMWQFVIICAMALQKKKSRNLSRVPPRQDFMKEKK